MTIITLKPAYLDITAVCSFLGLSAATIQKMVREGTFPKPRLLSGRRVAWLLRELEAWAEARPVSDLAPPENCGQGRPPRLKAA